MFALYSLLPHASYSPANSFIIPSEIGVSVSVSEVFATKSIAELVGIICTRISS